MTPEGAVRRPDLRSAVPELPLTRTRRGWWTSGECHGPPPLVVNLFETRTVKGGRARALVARRVKGRALVGSKGEALGTGKSVVGGPWFLSTPKRAKRF